MKLKDLKPTKVVKPFVSTPKLLINIEQEDKKILAYIVEVNGTKKRFEIKNHNYLLTFKKLVSYVEKNLK